MNFPAIIHPDAPPSQQWYVVARRAGVYMIPMFPKRMPMCGSPNEALERIRLTLAQDKFFSKKWDGWHFEPIPAGVGFQHKHGG